MTNPPAVKPPVAEHPDLIGAGIKDESEELELIEHPDVIGTEISLPDEMGDLREGPQGPLPAPGLHVEIIPIEPGERTRLENLGYHIVKRGERFGGQLAITNDHVFKTNDAGELINGGGDCVIGVIKASAYRNALKKEVLERAKARKVLQPGERRKRTKVDLNLDDDGYLEEL